MTDQQQRWIRELSRCRFLPGSYDKRFVQDMERQEQEQELSAKQAAFLERLAYRYRRQRGDVGMARPAQRTIDFVFQLTDEQRDSLNEYERNLELDKLRAWNEGKPL